MRSLLIATALALLASGAGNAASPQERAKVTRARFASRAAQMRIRDVRLSAESVGRFEKVEATFALDATYRNPYDPDEIRVDGQVTLPDGKSVTVPAFFDVPCEPVAGVAQMTLGVRYRETGAPCWKLRFAPSQVGSHRLRLLAREAGGRTAASEELRFSVQPSDRPGFVRVAEGNPAYFENSADGSLFWGSGANIAWTRFQDPGNPPSYEYYFGRARGQISSTRVWLCHWAWLEWMPRVDSPGTNWTGYAGLGWYNPMIADTLDRVFALAERDRVRVMLVTEDNDEHKGGTSADSWSANPYNAANGGPCAKPSDVFSSRAARDAYRKRLRYIVARWGYSDSLWAINSWNDCSDPDDTVLDWLREMRDCVHALTQGWRPLIYGSNFQHRANPLMDYAQGTTGLGRPAVVQECYYPDDAKWFVPMVRAQLWEGLATGKAAVMVWPHPVVDRLNAWGMFRPVLRFIESLPLNRGEWKPVAAEAVAAKAAGATGHVRVTELRAYGDVPAWGVRASRSQFVVEPDRDQQWLEGFSPNLYGANRAEWRNPPEFQVRLPAAGKMVVELAEIGGGTQKLGIRMDGKDLPPVAFEGGRRELKDAERWVTIPLAAGEHRVTLDNLGSDWLRMRTLYVAAAVDSPAKLVRVGGLRSGGTGFLYLRNQTRARVYQEVLHEKPTGFPEVRVAVRDLPPGRYEVKRFDTETGEVVETRTVEAPAGVLTLNLSLPGEDAAVRFERR